MQDCETNLDEIVKNTMLMLQTFFAETERKGTASIRPHGTLGQESELLQSILITSYVTSHNKPKYFVLSLRSVMTVWELIDYIAQKLDKSPFDFNLSRTQNKQAITYQDYCKTLK